MTEEQDLIAVSLPKDVVSELKWLAEQMNTTPLDALKKAIATQAYIQQEISKKGKENSTNSTSTTTKQVFFKVSSTGF